MRSSWASLLPTAILVVCSISSASGQSWADILKEKAAQQAVNAADQATDQGLDANEGAIRCLDTDQACIDQAQQQGRELPGSLPLGRPFEPGVRLDQPLDQPDEALH